MILNYFVLLTLLNYGLSAPDPNVKVDVNINVEDNGNNCCGDKSEDVANGLGSEDVAMGLPCGYNNTGYQSGQTIPTCMVLMCNDGKLEFQGKVKETCGKCSARGEPLVYPFDHLTISGLSNKPYWTDVNGEFVMAQPGFVIPADIYVNGQFAKSTCPGGISCVKGVTYHEPGITIQIELNAVNELEVFVTYGSSPKEEVTKDIDSTVSYFYGRLGAVLVFKHKHLMTPVTTNCISIVGNKDLNVVLCETDKSGLDYPSVYIFAQPALKSTTSPLRGLCNGWTGSPQSCFTENSVSCVTNWWDSTYVLNGPPGIVDGGYVIKDTLPTSWAFCNALGYPPC